MRAACVLHRKPRNSPTNWQGWGRLRARLGGQFHAVFATVSEATAHTPRSSALVENLNSRLRNYFTLRRHLGALYLDLLRFFLNHRRFVRSRRAERQGRSPCELMTGREHPHWLTLLGLGPLQSGPEVVCQVFFDFRIPLNLALPGMAPADLSPR